MLNQQYWLFTTKAVLAVACLLTATACSDHDANYYIKRAQADYGATKINAAIIDLKNALQVEPKNQQARLLLADYYLQIPDPLSAQAELLHAKQDGVNPALVAGPLAEADLLLGQASEALKATDVPGVAAPEPKATLFGLRAQAQIALGDLDGARETLASGSKENPHSVAVYEGQILYSLAKKDITSARKYLTDAQKEDPKNSTLFSLAGTVAFLASDYPAAENAYRNMLSVAPWNSYARIGIAKAEYAQNKQKEAEQTINAVLKNIPNDPIANYVGAVVAYRGGDYADAQTRVQKTLAVAPNFAPAILISGATNFALKQYELANSSLNKYVYLAPQDLAARKLLASTQVALGHSADAVKTLLPAVSQTTADTQLLAMIGEASARSGDLVAADHYFSEAVAHQPDNVALHTELGVTRLAIGQTDSGIEELQRAIQESPNELRPEMELFVAYLRDKQFDKALEVAQHLQTSHADNPIGWDYAGLAYLSMNQIEESKNALLKAREIKPGDSLTLRSLAFLALRENNLDQAKQYYQEILKTNPKEVQAYLDLAAVQFRAGHSDQMQSTLQTALQQVPDNSVPRIVLGRYYLLNGKAQDALNIVQPSLTKDPRNPGLLEIDGFAQLSLKNTDAATSAFKTLVDVQPNASTAHRDLGEDYAAVGNIDAALKEAQNAVALTPKDEASNIFYIQMMVAKKDYTGARKTVDQMLADNPKSALAAQLSGDIAMAQNQTDQAISAYRNAMAADDNAGIRVKLAQAITKAGNYSAAEQSLLTWLDGHPNDPQVQLALGAIYIMDKRLADAETQYAAVLSNVPNNAVAENNLAWVLSQDGRASEALSHARHAAALAPTSPDVLDTFGIVLLEEKQLSDAVAQLRKASDLAPNSPTIKFHLAEALMATGSKEEAKGILKTIVSGGQPFDGLEAAKEMLSQP